MPKAIPVPDQYHVKALQATVNWRQLCCTLMTVPRRVKMWFPSQPRDLRRLTQTATCGGKGLQTALPTQPWSTQHRHNDISISSAIFAGFTVVSNGQTHRPCYIKTSVAISHKQLVIECRLIINYGNSGKCRKRQREKVMQYTGSNLLCWNLD